MSDVAITVDGLSKAYRIGLKEALPDTAFSAAAGWLRSPLRNFRYLKRLDVAADETADDVLWALKDVSFEVKEGEVVGVIGRNGAGKSTLLKILSRITEPTSGRAIIHGRVSSLLEVGTGFHPELTGRDNIYMNGTILGMTKREIDRKFDEIVDFSGVEKFLDTPTKRYSSGMQVRLAFAVAAHLEPEILIVDEVLAVGDGEFQKKCLGKMRDVARTGRTVLFVSHNLAAVEHLCTEAIHVASGRIVAKGDVSNTLRDYARELTTTTPKITFPIYGTGAVLHSAFVLNEQGDQVASASFSDDLRFVVDIEMRPGTLPAHLLVAVNRASDGVKIASITTRELPHGVLHRGRRAVSCKLHRGILLPGEYTFDVSVKMGQQRFLDAVGPARLQITERVLSGASHAFTTAHGFVNLCESIESRECPV